MWLDLCEKVGIILFCLCSDFSAEAKALLACALFDDLIEAVKCSAADEEDICCVDLDEFLLRVLSAALRWNIGCCAFENLEKSLLYAFTAYIAGNRRIFALSCDFIQLVDIDNAAFCSCNIKICRLNKTEQDVFNVFTNIACFCESCCICNGERNIERFCESLGKVCLTGACRTDEKNIALLDFNIVAVIEVGNTLVMIINGDSESLLRSVLTDYIFVESFLDFAWLENGIHDFFIEFLLHFHFALSQNLVAHINADCADVNSRTGEDFNAVFLCSAAEAASEFLFVFLHFMITS